MFISMACIMAAVTVCAAPKISFSQDTKEATMAAYLGAMAYEDCDLMWQLMDPAVVKVAIAGSGSEEAAKKEFWKGVSSQINPQIVQKLKEVYNNNDLKQQAVAGLMQQYGHWLVKVNGKWYLNIFNEKK